MATYTLSHTGAEVDAAVTNATSLFSTAHTWTADQTFGNVLLPTGTLDAATVVGANANFGDLLIGDYPNSRLTVDAPATFTGATEITAAGSFTVGGPASFAQNITVTGDVSAGSATINGETDISGDLIVTGVLNASGPATFATITGTDIMGNRIESTLDLIAGRSIRINSDKVKLSFVTEAGTMSADGVYISTSGLTAVTEGDPYPANVLLIEFDY